MALSINSVFGQALRAVNGIALLKNTVGKEGQIGFRSKEEVFIIMREINIQSIHEKAPPGFYGVHPFKFCTKVVCFVALLLGFTVNFATADELFMKNGDRLQGKIKSMSKGKLIFETSYAGDITIDWGQVERLVTEGPFEVQFSDDKSLKGRVVSEEDGTLNLQPENGSTPQPITMAEVKTISPPPPPPSWKLDARISAGLSIESGNTNNRKFNADGQVGLKKYPHRITLYGEANLEEANDKETANNSLLNLDYNYFLSKKWYLFGNGLYQRDRFQDLTFLGAGSAGAGYQFWHSEEKNLTIKIGPSYVTERYSKPQANFGGKDERNYAAGFWAFDFDMWFFNRLVQFFHHDDVYLSLSDTDVWRLRTRTGFRIPVVYKLFTSLQYNYDWVNSPADGKTNYDDALLFKLGWQY
jgi:hypothetical protein